MKTLSVAKLALYGMFFNYYCYYVINGHFISHGTVLFFAIACVCVGFDILNERAVYVRNEVKCWILYALLTFLTTSMMNVDASFIGDIAKYVQRLIIIMIVAYICEREKSIRFGLQLMAFTAVTCSISILMVVDDIQQKLSISTGAKLSANDIGSIMAFGCFAILFCVGNRRRSSLVLSGMKMAGVIAAITVIFLAGSRKSIIAVIIMAVLLVLLCATDYRKHYNWQQIFVMVIIGIASYMFINKYLLPYAEQTNLYTRILGRGAEAASNSDELRLDLYKRALQDFLHHPLFGLGFNQFLTAHGNYTHSTYVEPLACSGLIGLLYLYPYFSILRKQIYLIRINRRGSLERLKQKEIFVYFCMFLFVGVGIPYMYKDIPCILLGTFIASQAISFKELRRNGITSASY